MIDADSGHDGELRKRRAGGRERVLMNVWHGFLRDALGDEEMRR